MPLLPPDRSPHSGPRGWHTSCAPCHFLGAHPEPHSTPACGHHPGAPPTADREGGPPWSGLPAGSQLPFTLRLQGSKKLPVAAAAARARRAPAPVPQLVLGIEPGSAPLTTWALTTRAWSPSHKHGHAGAGSGVGPRSRWPPAPVASCPALSPGLQGNAQRLQLERWGFHRGAHPGGQCTALSNCRLLFQIRRGPVGKKECKENIAVAGKGWGRWGK